MPRYRVIERRALKTGVIIEADDEKAASNYQGNIIDEYETDTWSDELLSCEQVDDDCDDVGSL